MGGAEGDHYENKEHGVKQSEFDDAHGEDDYENEEEGDEGEEDDEDQFEDEIDEDEEDEVIKFDYFL